MYNETQYTQQVRELLKRISASSSPSVLKHAANFFVAQKTIQPQRDSYNERIDELTIKLAQKINNKNKVSLQRKLAKAKNELDSFEQLHQEQRLVRHDQLVTVAREILALSEGLDFEDTQRKSAKLLGTISLLNPSEGRQVAEYNDRSKHLYKAILCLRLFDQMYLDKMITDPYILNCLAEVPASQYQDFINETSPEYQLFTEQVKVPLIMVAVLQDIGNHHPDAKRILYGETSTANPYRILEPAIRKELLQINYSETMKYLSLGIGAGKYIGNFKLERDAFDESEKAKVAFMQSILKRWADAQDIIGNLLKVPQIYTSIVLSTKANYDYRMLPKVYQVLKLNVERGHCLVKVVNCMYKITGMFPMGYGITYIPKDSSGQPLDRFEYAIVNHLYPQSPQQPECRVATRSLTFISRGQDIRIEKESNLYFPETAKKLSKMSKARLNEILELLASNYKERQNLDVLPRCWHAKEFFSIGKNQNLWNKVNE